MIGQTYCRAGRSAPTDHMMACRVAEEQEWELSGLLVCLQVAYVVAPRGSAMLHALDICVPCRGFCTGLACLGGARASLR